jgi:hypothetical protein
MKNTNEAALLDDHAVDLFTKAMKEKLRLKRQQGCDGWNNIGQRTGERLAELLIAAIAKGDPVDVANFAMMLFCQHESHDALKTAYAASAGGAVDSVRYKWVLPMLTGGDDVTTQTRTLRLGAALMLGLDGNAAVDHAMNMGAEANPGIVHTTTEATK